MATPSDIAKRGNVLTALMLAAVALLLAMATACAPTPAPEAEWQAVDTDGWRYGKVLTFNAKGDTLATDTMAIAVRHTGAYPYANLWVELAYNTADTVSADTFNIVLADDFGNWYGQGNGVSYQRIVSIRPSRRVAPGSKLKLRHIMRTDTLPEIEQMGIIF